MGLMACLPFVGTTSCWFLDKLAVLSLPFIPSPPFFGFLFCSWAQMLVVNWVLLLTGLDARPGCALTTLDLQRSPGVRRACSLVGEYSKTSESELQIVKLWARSYRKVVRGVNQSGALALEPSWSSCLELIVVGSISCRVDTRSLRHGEGCKVPVHFHSGFGPDPQLFHFFLFFFTNPCEYTFVTGGWPGLATGSSGWPTQGTVVIHLSK
ncbi:hypothetical protein B0J13DRAFT_153054 [Dactylonectria estremocensis]|uniref:Uncharacterized protein n=1 Tax=Dactylonectria estremocensis TaxID=1079267 RepID=A0A9P9DRQ3_9HYPO|nr:hypothetical protein B0J13DRAFT_153054 [Dactylonectria estremocensis]